MKIRKWRFVGLSLIWLTIYVLIGYPKGFPYEQYVAFLITSQASSFFLSLEEE